MGRTEPFQAPEISFQVFVGPHLNSTNGGSIADAEAAASSGNAQDFSGADQGPVPAADVEYPAAMPKGGRVPTPTLPSYNIMQQPRQSDSLQPSFNFKDTYEKLLKENSAILAENKRLQTDIRGLEQQMAQLIDRCAALRSSLDLQMRFRQGMGKKYDDHPKINEPEAPPHGQTQSGSYQESEATPALLPNAVGGVQVAVDKKYDDFFKIFNPEALHGHRQSGSYQESEAKPPLLQNAADGVKAAIGVCARIFFRTFKQNPSINFDTVLEGVPTHLRDNEAVKAGLQGMICRVFFQGFGDPYFLLIEKPVPPFQTPSERKVVSLQDFRRCRDNPNPKHLLHDDSDFRLFFTTKVDAMNQEIKTQLLRPTKVQFAIDNFANGVLNPNNKNSIYGGTFVRAAKTVWVLHKVAISFKPQAGIFWVGSGSFLDRTYMEDIAAHDEDAEENKTAALQKKVMFMCVPGFTVRDTVIKSKVFCLLPTIKA